MQIHTVPDRTTCDGRRNRVRLLLWQLAIIAFRRPDFVHFLYFAIYYSGGCIEKSIDLQKYL